MPLDRHEGVQSVSKQVDSSMTIRDSTLLAMFEEAHRNVRREGYINEVPKRGDGGERESVRG